MNVQRIQLIDLERLSSEGTQTRAGLREHAIAEYAELIRNGARMEPSVVFADNETLHLAAGFHRREAYKRAGKAQMPCFMKVGTKWDAIEYGIQNNRKHLGERVTREDKAHNVRLVLREKPEYSDGMIAELCGVSHSTVAQYRAELVSARQIGRLTARTGRDGRTRSTANLGRRPSSSPALPPEQRAGEDPAPGPIADDKRCGLGIADTPGGTQPAQVATEPGIERGPCGGRRIGERNGGGSWQACHPENVEQQRGEEDGFLPIQPPTGPVGGSAEIELYRQTVRSLGVLKRCVDDLAKASPGPDHARLVALLEMAGDVLRVWGRRIEIPED